MERITPDEERLSRLDQLAELIDSRSVLDYDFRRATGSLAEDLQYISKSIRRDVTVWRLNRAFHAVHIPSLLAIMSMLENVDEMKSVGESVRSSVYL